MFIVMFMCIFIGLHDAWFLNVWFLRDLSVFASNWGPSTVYFCAVSLESPRTARRLLRRGREREQGLRLHGQLVDPGRAPEGLLS